MLRELCVGMDVVRVGSVEADVVSVDCIDGVDMLVVDSVEVVARLVDDFDVLILVDGVVVVSRVAIEPRVSTYKR